MTAIFETSLNQIEGEKLAEANEIANTQLGLASATLLPVDHEAIDTQEDDVDGIQLATATPSPDTHKGGAVASQLAEARLPLNTQDCDASATIPATATDVTETHTSTAVAPQLAEASREPNTHSRRASASNFSDSQRSPDAHTRSAVAEPISVDDQGHTDAHPSGVVDGTTSAGSQATSDAHIPTAPGGFLRDPVLGVLADVVDDLESVRIANANRVRQLTRTETDKDGEERGFGLTLDHPEVAKLALTVKALEQAEHDAILNLKRALRKHPLAPFQKRHKGIGEKQLARLLAVIGDPYWNDLHERPRTVSELWAYAGFHVIKTSGGHTTTEAQTFRAAGFQPHTGSQSPNGAQSSTAPGVAPKRTRGQKSNWSEDARKRVWVIASAMPKFPGGHYEQVYRAAREKYADSIHGADCVRCGPSGKPAPAGTPLSDGHKHARAVRIVAKEILKDLWLEARHLYEEQQ